MSATRNRNIMVAGGLVLFGGLMFSVPVLFKATSPTKNLQNSERPLTGSQMQRGLYIQAGQRDVGPDPNWVNGVYIPNKAKKER